MTRQTEPNNAITQYAYSGLVYTVTNALNQTRTETKNSQGLHDGLNRLTSSEIFGSPAKTVTYNAIGNIVTKSDVGTYTYPTTGSARPHAVASIAGSLTTSFTYDANGNMLTGNARTLTWTSFNMPATIARGASTAAFTYDPEYNRIKQTTPDGATHYLWDSASGVNIEKFIGSGGSTQWSNYVFASGQMVAVFYERTPGPSATRYFHKDPLGSLAVITDEAGAVSERLAYDSWGKRRHPNGADDPGEAITSQANRGYTGHEHLEEVGLVHMNGRIYEPLVARFMSSDPIVQDPFSTQSLNRYSYVMNNPMAHTDPTGFFAEGLGLDFGFGYGSAWDYAYGYTTYYSPVWNVMLYQPEIQPSQPVYSKGITSARGTGASESSFFADAVAVINRYVDAVKMTPAEFAWEMTAGAGLYKSGHLAAQRGGWGYVEAAVFYTFGAAEQAVAYSGFVIGPQGGAATVAMVGGIKITTKMALRVGGKIIDDVSSLGVKAEKTSGSKSLLPGEGSVGTFDNLLVAGVKGDDITPHHIPSANHMAQHGVSKGDGIAINMEHPVPGSAGRHRSTFTFGTQADVNLTPRQALGRGIWDARGIYQLDELYGPRIRSSLQDVIRQNRAANPGLFDK
jgi:RHS repeat-associated protein